MLEPDNRIERALVAEMLRSERLRALILLGLFGLMSVGTLVVALTQGDVLVLLTGKEGFRDLALSGLPISMFDTHSFRAGGACALWAAGYTTDTIRILGRWASDCWMIYVTQADSRLQRLTTDMLNAVTDSVFYARIHDLLRVDPFEAQPLGV